MALGRFTALADHRRLAERLSALFFETSFTVVIPMLHLAVRRRRVGTDGSPLAGATRGIARGRDA